MHSNSVFDFENVTGSEIFSIIKADFLPYHKHELSKKLPLIWEYVYLPKSKVFFWYT